MLLSVWFVLPNLRKTRAFDEKMRACIEPVIVDSVFVAVAGLTIRVLGSFFSSCSTPLMGDTQLGEITPANVNQIWLLPVRFELSDQIFCNIFNNYRNHLRNSLIFYLNSWWPKIGYNLHTRLSFNLCEKKVSSPMASFSISKRKPEGVAWNIKDQTHFIFWWKARL